MSAKLEDIRKKIDELDDKIHDLLMERADLIVSISEEKKKNNIEVVQPAREAKMIRRLLARHRGPLPEAAIVKIWRELVGAVSLLQKGIKVSVSTDASSAACWDMAKEYFGTVLPMVKASAPVACVSAVREDEASFAVVPWPQDGETNPWWPHLLNQEKNKMRIVCAMPYGFATDQASGAQDRALAIAKTDFAPSGEDRTFIALQLAREVSRTRIIDGFKDVKLKVLWINTRNDGMQKDSLHLVEVDDYVSDKDERLAKFVARLDALHVRSVVLGGYPVPPVYKNAASQSEKAPGAKAAKTGT